MEQKQLDALPTVVLQRAPPVTHSFPPSTCDWSHVLGAGEMEMNGKDQSLPLRNS